MKKIVSLLLALCLALSLSMAFAEDADWTMAQFAAAADIRTTLAADYTGKTVILHSNDVHGQVDGYAWIAGLRSYFDGLGAKTLLVDAGDFSQGDIYVSASKGAAEAIAAAGGKVEE